MLSILSNSTLSHPVGCQFFFLSEKLQAMNFLETGRKHSTCSEKSMTSVASDASGWLTVSASQNLAAVLNDPNRGKQKDFFTKVWGVDFVEAPLAIIPPNPHLPLVTRAHFETYLRKISKRHRRHDQLRSQLTESQQFPAQRRRQRSLERRIEPLDIPSIFLQTDFDLSQPVVFNTALPFARAGITVDGAFRQNGKILQEKVGFEKWRSLLARSRRNLKNFS